MLSAWYVAGLPGHIKEWRAHLDGDRWHTSCGLAWCMGVCMENLYCCIVACTYLGSGSGHRTATMAAHLLLTSGPVRCEAVLHSCGASPVGGRVATCDSVHSWWFNSVTSLGYQATGSMTCYHIQSHYSVTEPTSPCPILIMTNAGLGGNYYQFDSSVWLDQVSKMWGPYSNQPPSDSPISQNGRRMTYSFSHPD